MTEIRKVLAAIDGSESSDRALSVAISLTKQFNAQLKVVTILRPPPVPWALEGPGAIIVPPPRAGESDATDAIVRKANEEIAAASITGAAEIVRSGAVESVDRVILDSAESFGAEMIVVGHRGLGRLQRVLMGSVSAGVVSGAKCPVLVVK